MNAANFPVHIAATLNAEIAKRGAPTPCHQSDEGFFFRFRDGALARITYNFSTMQWNYMLDARA